jgi:two-component system, sensor histidine kinase and response regulator
MNHLLHQPSIMLVEDDIPVRDMMGVFLQQHYTVFTADNGAAALDTIRQTTPDVIVSDVTMPEMSGYDLLRQVREDRHIAMIPFIFLTAQADYNNMRDGMNHGADDYLFKPVEMHELKQAIDAQLQKRQVSANQIDDTIKIVRENLLHALPHELRTPLFQIIGYTQMLREEYTTLGQEEVGFFLDVIGRSGERLQRVVENYSSHLQLETIMLDPNRQQLLRNHIIPNAADIILRTVEPMAYAYDRPSDLRHKLEARAMRISEENLAKLVFELADNAFKFSLPGTPVGMGSFTKDDSYHIIIEDRGRGISPVFLDKLGQPFMQFEREEYEQQGVGLGFSIANRIVQAHGGSVTVQSKNGEGTRVHVQLPLK